MYLVFIDLVKAFDTVDRSLFFENAKNVGLAAVLRNVVEAIQTTPYGRILPSSQFLERGVTRG